MNVHTPQMLDKSDHFATNLAVVNKLNAVTTTENIYNNFGKLIVAKGVAIDARAYQIIIKHKLQKPIENSIQLANTLTPNNIYQQFTTLTEHAELKVILSQKIDVTILLPHCQQLEEFPLLLQKLTILQSLFPVHYRKTIFGAILSALLCHEQKLTYEVTNNTFLAALFRDLGLLHIDPLVVEKKGKLSVQEWKLLQGHVPISYNITKMTPRIPSVVALAVLEHHETADGFGYPFYKLESNLSLEGQIVAFADTFVALFHKHILYSGFYISWLEPIIQINSGVNLHQNTQAAMRLIRRYSPKIDTTKNNAEIVALVKILLLRQPNARKWFNRALLFNKLLITKHSNSSLERTTKFIDREQSVLLRSGISDQLFLDWLCSLDLSNISTSDALEIEKSWLMLNEISWRFEQLLKTFKAIVADIQVPDEELQALQANIALLQDNLNHLTP